MIKLGPDTTMVVENTEPSEQVIHSKEVTVESIASMTAAIDAIDSTVTSLLWITCSVTSLLWITCSDGSDEQASFTPLVFSTTGGMGGEALTFYRRLADMLSRHSSTSYSGTLAWIRCTLSFSLLRSATMCIRGTRSILHRSNNASPEMGHIAGPRDF